MRSSLTRLVIGAGTAHHRVNIERSRNLPVTSTGAKAPRSTFHARESSKAHARPPAPRTDRQPHRRRRSGRASGERGQGTGGKRHRRRRQPGRHLHRWRRPAADRHHRRRQRHDPWRSGAVGRPPRHLQARRRGSVADPHAGISRRGAALDRRGGQARHHHAPSQRAACLVAGGGRRRQIRDHAGGAEPGHPRRGQRSVLCDAGAAEIPQDRPHRGRSDPRSGAPARDGAARYRLHAGRRGTRAGDLGRRPARRRRKADAARRYPGQRIFVPAPSRCAASATAWWSRALPPHPR